jgi:hypothetical protein
MQERVPLAHHHMCSHRIEPAQVPKPSNYSRTLHALMRTNETYLINSQANCFLCGPLIRFQGVGELLDMHALPGSGVPLKVQHAVAPSMQP